MSEFSFEQLNSKEKYYLASEFKKFLRETPIKEICPEIEADEKFKNSTIEKEMNNETLWENVFQGLIKDISQGQEPGNIDSARNAIKDYVSLKFSGPSLAGPLSVFKEKFPLEYQKVEEGIKNETLWKNALREQIKDISQGQKPGETEAARRALEGCINLSTLLSELEKPTDQK